VGGGGGQQYVGLVHTHTPSSQMLLPAAGVLSEEICNQLISAAVSHAASVRLVCQFYG